MTKGSTTLEVARRGDEQAHECLGCGQVDNHPKQHVLYGKNLSTGRPDWAHLHHDCSEQGIWHEQFVGDPSGEGDRFRAIIDKAFGGVRGDALRAWIGEHLPTIGTGPRMATTGLAIGMGIGVLDALHPNSGTKTIGALTITAPINLRAMSVIGATDAAAGTEITTGNSYTSGGAGLGSPTWGAAGNVGNVASTTTVTSALTKTNMPARTIVALEEWDSSATPLRGLWGAVTTLVTNSGDTVSIAVGALADTLS
jgi:hypothetical protein